MKALSRSFAHMQRLGKHGMGDSSAHSNSDQSELNISKETYEELLAKNLSAFVKINESSERCITIQVFQNEKWHPTLKTWGSVVGVHLNAVFDRSPWTNSDGTKVISGSQTDIQPISGYKWEGDWDIIIEPGQTDEKGYHYAHGWSLLADGLELSKANPLTYVRRRRWKRKMVVDSHPTIRNAPYELSMRIKRGTLHGGSTSHSYVQTFVDDELVDTTPKGPPDWNRPVVKKLMTIVPTTTITFVLYSMPLIAIPVPGSKAVAPVFRGKFQTNIGSFLHTLGNGGSDKEFPFSPSKDTLVINIELKETKLFTIISAHPPLLTELAASSAMEVSPYLKKRVCLIDNASNQFLNLILAILLENTALVNEPDMVYLVGDICDMVLMYVSGGKHVEQMDEVQRLPKSKIISNTVRAFTRDRTVGDLASKLSEGVGFDSSSGNFGENLYNFLRDAVTSYDKTTLYPYVSNIYNTFVCPKGLYRQKHDNSSTSHVKALIREQEIIWRNEKSHTLQPCMSSCYNMATERHLLRRLDFRDNSLYDIIIHCSDETSYELRWADYYDYIMALKHISTVKFSLENADAAADQIFTTKCSMAIREDLLFNPSKFNTELPNDQRFQIIFSIQTGSGCFLLEDEDHLFDEDSNEISIPFDGVESIEVCNNSYMPWSHVLELKMHTASSSLIRSNNSQQMYRNCFIEARTADGQYKKISLDEIKTNTLLTDEFLRLSPGTRAAVGEEGKQFPITVSFKNDRTQLLIPPNVAKLANKRFQEDYKHDSFVQLKFVIPGYYPAQSTTKQKQNSHEREAEPVTPQRLPSTDKGKNDSDDEDGGGSGRRKSMFNMNPMNMNIPKTPFHMPNMNMPKINMPKMNMNMPKMNMSNMKVPGFQGKQPEPERRTSFETPEKAPQESEQVRPKKRTEPLTQYNTQLESAISLPLEKIKYSHLEEQSQWFFPSGTTAYSLYLHIKAMQNLFPIDTSGFSDPYFYVYFADQNGHPIMPYDTHKSNINMTKILTVGLLQGNEVAQKNGYPYKSPVIPRTLSPNWNLDIKFSSEDLPAEMSNAMYILITIWDSNTLKSDASMGEVYIPISSAYTLKSPSKTYIPVISNKNIKTYSIQPTKTIQAKKLSPKTSFGIMTGSLSKVEFTTSDANDGEMIVVKLASQLRMLTSTDCAWPCRVLNVSFTGGLEEDIFHVFLGHEGLHLSSSPGASSKSKAASARMNVLRSCVEALPLEEGVHMVIPYSHIDLSATHILADNMLLVGLFIQRVVGNRVAGSNHIEKLREVPLDVIVSPCLAHDMYCFIQSRVSVNDVRQSLTEAMYTSEEEQDKIARVVQSELLATIETIEAVSMEGRGVLEDTLRLSFLQEKDEVSTSSDPGAGGVVKRSEYGMRTANKYTLALRYLTIKKSFYQLYLQYYIQYSILVGELDGAASKLPEVIFSAETISQITMRTKMILNGEETEAEDEDDGGDRAVDHVSLVQRLQVIMEHMDKDVRALIFQQIRQSTEVSAASNIEKTTKLLSQLIYDQYLLIIAYINSVLSEKGSKAVLKNEESKGVVRALIPGTGMVKNMFNSVGIGKKDDKIAAASINGAQVELDQAELDKNPQRKRDLIRFILTQDNLFEIHLSANLHSCSYRFSSRPVLSKCVDFDDLISKFYVLLNENLQMWNNRTLQHFKKVRDGSQNSFVPWELVALMDQKSGKELISSEIPETVQSQLNTQIGLKKIPVDFGNLSSLSLKRVIKINYKISSSIAKAYINIAGEYERVLNEKMLQLQKTATVVKRGVLRNLAHKSGLSLATNVLIVGPTRLLLTGSLATGSATGSTTSDGSDEEEIMAFLMSVANDSRRIRLIHIPESIASFDSGVASNLEKSLFTNTEYTSMLSSNQLLFSNAITTFESVTKHAMNALANQLIFNCADVRSFILEGFEEYLSKMLKLYNTPSKTVESPMETIAGTIVDFFQFTSERLNPDDLYSLTFIIVKKIVLRYLLFARDFLVRSKSKSVAINHFISGTTQLATRLTTETIDDFGKIIVGTLKLPGDMMSLIRSETKEAVDSGAANDDDSDAVVDHENSGGEQMDNISKLFTEDQFLLIKKDLKLILDMYAKVNSIISPDVIAQDVEEEEEVEEGEEEEEDEEEREARKAAKVQNRPARQHESIALTNTTATATVMLLSLLSDTLTAMLFGEVASASHLDGIMTSQFHVTPPIRNSDAKLYQLFVESYLSFTAYSTSLAKEAAIEANNAKLTPGTVIAPAVGTIAIMYDQYSQSTAPQEEDRRGSTGTGGASRYKLNFSDFKCIKLLNPKFCIVRIKISGHVVSSSICDKVDSLVWRDNLSFDDIGESYEAMTAVIDVVDIRPLLRRERIHGRAVVHLSELKDFINQTQRNSEGSQDSNAGHFADGFTGWLVLHPLDSNDNGKGRRNSSANARESEMNAFTDILSSDNPREGIQLPQLKLRIQMELH